MRPLWCVLFLVLGLDAAPASAAPSALFSYSFDQVWQTSIRLIRVDMACPITDRDQETGFILFEYVDGNRRHPGSIELVRATVEGAERIRATVKVPAMPTYISQMILDKLGRKLVEDYGEPIRRPRPPADDERPEPPVGDGDEDDGDDDDDDGGDGDDGSEGDENRRRRRFTGLAQPAY